MILEKMNKVNFYFYNTQDIDCIKFPAVDVCLIYVNDYEFKKYISKIVHGLFSKGCHFFMTWGSLSELVHDQIDEILEIKGDDYLNAITTYHNNESISEVLWFLTQGSIPDKLNINCIFIYDKIDKISLGFINEIKVKYSL